MLCEHLHQKQSNFIQINMCEYRCAKMKQHLTLDDLNQLNDTQLDTFLLGIKGFEHVEAFDSEVKPILKHYLFRTSHNEHLFPSIGELMEFLGEDKEICNILWEKVKNKLK